MTTKGKPIISKEKSNGRIYTPAYLVRNILDLAGYYDDNIAKKHVIDNSCGDGAFLTEIVDRYCQFQTSRHVSSSALSKELATYIHGIEKDSEECNKCVCNLNQVIRRYGIVDVPWDICCADTLETTKFDGKMDFVLGNPPYIRVHNLGKSLSNIKTYSFSKQGMTDLFIVFYEIGLRMLNKSGVLGYITPSSFFNSIAGDVMRKYLVKNCLIDKIVDLKHFQAFSAMTYTAIVILKKSRQSSDVEYFQFDEKNGIPYFVETLCPNDFYFSGNFYFAKKEDLEYLKSVFYNIGRCNASVKNGFATLCDEVYINDFGFKSNYIIPAIKASCGTKKSMVYPYDKHGKVVSEQDLAKDVNVYNYLLRNKTKLLNRSREKRSECWYAFGRSQAIKDTYEEKLSLNNLVRNVSDLKIHNVPSGSGVYSGLYIISSSINAENLIRALKCEDFVKYVTLLGKYKSGGYYTYSSKDVKAYLDYKLAYSGGIIEK